MKMLESYLIVFDTHPVISCIREKREGEELRPSPSPISRNPERGLRQSRAVAARKVHTLEAAGSNPASATIHV